MNNRAIGENWITIGQGARLTGWSITHVRRLAIQGLVDAVKLGRDWWVDRESLLAYQKNLEALGRGKFNPWRDDLGQGRGRKR